MEITCTHPNGDTVNGYWLCGQCYAKLQERPREYVWAPEPPRPYAEGLVKSQASSRQEVVFAPIAQHDGITLAAFIDMMARRLVARTRGGFQMADAKDYAVECLRSLAEPFGSSDLAWDEGGAWDLVDEDLSYWDEDSRGTNG